MPITRDVIISLDEFDLTVALRPPTREEWAAYSSSENAADAMRDLALACMAPEMASRLLEVEQDYPAVLHRREVSAAIRELSGSAAEPATPSPVTPPGRRHRVVAFRDPSGAEHTWVLVPPSVTEFRAFRDTAATDSDATLLLFEACTKQIIGSTPRDLVGLYPAILDAPVVSVPMGQLTGLVASDRKKG